MSYAPVMQLVRKYRERAGVSQEALAEAAGLSVRTVRRIEHDADYDPGVSTAARVAQALGVTVDDLLHTENRNHAATRRGEISRGDGTHRQASAAASKQGSTVAP